MHTKHTTNRAPRPGRSLALTLALIAGLGLSPVDAGELEDLVALVDTSNLVAVDNIVIPPGVFEYQVRSGWSLGSLSQAFVGEQLDFAGTNPRGFLAQSENYNCEIRTKQIGLMLQLRENSTYSKPVAGSETALPGDAKNRLNAIGIDLEETSAPESRHLLSQSLVEDGEPTAPELFAYKQFIQREIAGVPVLGSRFVFTYTPDFTLKKVLGYWPTMAADGHQLTSNLTPNQVAEIVAQHLIDTGQTDVEASIPLRYVYAARQSGTRIRLDLQVEAMLLDPSTEDDEGEVEKVRVLMIDLPS